METQENTSAMPGVLFREIHKNSFLKRVSSDKRGAFPRRTERVWTVFCVHDDTEAFLELYTDHKVALSHKPEWFVSLHNAVHISPSIVGNGDDFEFAVTLPTQVVRLAAPSWDSMMEWVDTIRNKLRELRVLAPKENLYSKMPEPRHILLPTRDPTSPLPLPPVGPAGLVPGVESPPRPSASAISPPQTSEDLINGSPRANITGLRDAVTNVRNITSDLNRSRSVNITNSQTRVEVLEPMTSGSSRVIVAGSTRNENLSSELLASSRVSNLNGQSSNDVIAVQVERKKEKVSIPTATPGSSVVVVNDDNVLAMQSRRPPPPLPDVDDSSSSSEAALTAISPSVGGRRLMRASSVPSSSNVTVIEVPPPSSAGSHYEHLFLPDPLTQADNKAKLERVSSSGLIPRVPPKVSRDSESRTDKVSSPLRVNTSQTSHESEGYSGSRGAGPSLMQRENQQHTSVVNVKPHETSVQVPPKAPPKQTAVVRVTPPSNIVDLPIHTVSPTINNEVGNREITESVAPIPAAFHPAPASLEVRDIPLIGGHQRRRRRSSSSDAGPVMRGLMGADLIRVAPAEAPEMPADAPRRTLRETQVCQLRREMGHPGGVRLPLRRKDCVGAIALVDISNGVWVAGWKQREHPMLYNALHIGDRVVSVGDVPVRTASDAQKLLRGIGGPTVELVVRRLPLAVVLALQRPRGGGDVGLVPDSNSAAEVTVAVGGVAAKSGLPPRTATMDGLSLTTWTLTEINGRPLNLFCKPNDVTTRLNSVGKELSVLVQPSDFIKQLRKQLKAMRGYKEYLLL